MFVNRYKEAMLSRWLHDALKRSGKGQAETARFLTAALGRSIDRAAVNKMVSGKRKIQADELVALEEYTGEVAPRGGDNPLTGAELAILDYARKLDEEAKQEVLAIVKRMVPIEKQ